MERQVEREVRQLYRSERGIGAEQQSNLPAISKAQFGPVELHGKAKTFKEGLLFHNQGQTKRRTRVILNSKVKHPDDTGSAH